MENDDVACFLQVTMINLFNLLSVIKHLTIAAIYYLSPLAAVALISL